jgi:hypothetical protein
LDKEKLEALAAATEPPRVGINFSINPYAEDKIGWNPLIALRHEDNPYSLIANGKCQLNCQAGNTIYSTNKTERNLALTGKVGGVCTCNNTRFIYQVGGDFADCAALEAQCVSGKIDQCIREPSSMPSIEHLLGKHETIALFKTTTVPEFKQLLPMFNTDGIKITALNFVMVEFNNYSGKELLVHRF